MKKFSTVVLPLILITAFPVYGMESQVSNLWPDFSIPETRIEEPETDEKVEEEQTVETAPVPEAQKEETPASTEERGLSEEETVVEEKEEPVKIDLNLADDDCQLWWIIMLLLLFINIVFISSLKIFSDRVMRVKHWRRYIYIFPFITSIAAWGAHEYLHYHHFHYPETFFCFNYEALTFLVGGYILILYFYLIGFRDKAEKTQQKLTKNKQKKKKE